MRLGERIKALLIEQNKRRSELARHLDVSVQAVAGWLVGGSDPLPSKRAKIAEFFGVSEEELMFGPAHDRSSVRSVPIISWAEATDPRRAVDNDLAVYISTRFQVSIPMQRHTFALTVQGESMINPTGYPSFPPGTIIAAEPDVEAVNGDFVLARMIGIDNAAFGQLVMELGRRFLKPLNPRYPLVELGDRDAVVATVMEFGARLKA